MRFLMNFSRIYVKTTKTSQQLSYCCYVQSSSVTAAVPLALLSMVVNLQRLVICVADVFVDLEGFSMSSQAVAYGSQKLHF